MSPPPDDPNLPVSPAEIAAIEFYLRCRIADPLKSWFKPKELAKLVSTSSSKAGAALSVVSGHAPDLELEKRPGGRGGARYGVRRRSQPDDEPRTWWIQRGERVQEGPA